METHEKSTSVKGQNYLGETVFGSPSCCRRRSSSSSRSRISRTIRSRNRRRCRIRSSNGHCIFLLRSIMFSFDVPIFKSWASQRWTAERIHQKDLVAILRLLVVIARQFKPEMRFQARIFLTVIIARKLNGKLEYLYEREYITEFTEILPGYLFHITLYSLAIDQNSFCQLLVSFEMNIQ
ncbi:uncharacterized protein DC041_0009952 [Schistosoma bovis]|uniref:Uncharacterized protein n=1 Tax=Schistosoma bovis TaxID=6184 RepID=A0A430Q1N0_SCHBO|nr:uncharacterized protein DC041_0009952 [Schistosoma bovis]